MLTECGSLPSFALCRHMQHGRYCYKQAVQVKLQVFYHVLAICQQQGYQGLFWFEYGVLLSF